MQIVGDGCAGSRRWRRIAPALASAVVPAGACEFGNAGLHQHPSVPDSSSAALEDHRRAALAGAIDIHAAAADMYRLTDLRREAIAIVPPGHAFIAVACDHQNGD